jgi:hypothetical protein
MFCFAVEGFDPIDWNGRMRVIMGVAYCIQHMHELNPSIAHPDLQSSAILLSEDGAAKVQIWCRISQLYFLEYLEIFKGNYIIFIFLNILRSSKEIT